MENDPQDEGRPSRRLLIVDDDFAAGRLQFSSAVYSVNEYETNAVITVIRTNGTTAHCKCRGTHHVQE